MYVNTSIDWNITERWCQNPARGHKVEKHHPKRENVQSTLLSKYYTMSASDDARYMCYCRNNNDTHVNTTSKK